MAKKKTDTEAPEGVAITAGDAIAVLSVDGAERVLTIPELDALVREASAVRFALT